VDREQILEQLLKLVTETGDPDRASPVTTLGSPEPSAKWCNSGATLWSHNTWLIPEEGAGACFATSAIGPTERSAFCPGLHTGQPGALENEAKSQHQVPR